MDIFENLLESTLDGAFESIKHTSATGADTIYLVLQKDNGDCFSFRLTREIDNFSWQRKQWNQQNEEDKLSKPSNVFKNLGSKFIPDALIQKGFLQTKWLSSK